MTSSHLRNGSLTDKWPIKSVDNPRKSTTNGPTVLNNNRPRDVHAHTMRNDDEANPPTSRSAENIHITDLDENVNNNTRNEVPLRRGQGQINDCPQLSTPQAMLAVQRLERLKELQRRRDLTEKYYSQEIGRVIGEHYFGPRLNAPVARDNDKIINPAIYQYPESRSKSVFKTLEPCGTMTTITHLDCGCMQQTTRPIFTTITGRVNKRSCSQFQDPVLLKLTSSGPKEHLYSTNAASSNLPYYATKPKQRSLLNSTAYAKIPEEMNDGIEDNRNEQSAMQETEIAGCTSRPSSPLRQYSDTSSASSS